uniref:Uncharacterized protein n=1 Tax=Rhizophora mucronata TaxID=61149 RepID=A0A2P2P9T0_RHIMU
MLTSYSIVHYTNAKSIMKYKYQILYTWQSYTCPPLNMLFLTRLPQIVQE